MEIKREIEQHELFSIMMKKVKKEGMSVSSNSLKRTVLNSTSVFKDLLTKSSKNFEDYTLHDEYHALAVMTLMLKIIPKEEMITSVVCGQLCGSDHANMKAMMEVISQKDFNDFLNKESKKSLKLKGHDK